MDQLAITIEIKRDHVGSSQAPETFIGAKIAAELARKLREGNNGHARPMPATVSIEVKILD